MFSTDLCVVHFACMRHIGQRTLSSPSIKCTVDYIWSLVVPFVLTVQDHLCFTRCTEFCVTTSREVLNSFDRLYYLRIMHFAIKLKTKTKQNNNRQKREIDYLVYPTPKLLQQFHNEFNFAQFGQRGYTTLYYPLSLFCLTIRMQHTWSLLFIGLCTP